MQQSGTLKKRKRRNIAKVTGLSTIAYNEEEDDFDTRAIFNRVPSEDQLPFGIGTQTSQDTRLSMSHYLQRENLGSIPPSAARATRNPAFHYEDSIDEEQGRRASSYQPEKDLQEYIDERPCFLDKTTMTRLRQILVLGIASGTFPWKWNGKTQRIDRWSPRLEFWWDVQWFLVTVQTALLTVFQYYSFFDRIGSEVKTYREIFMASFSVFWYTCAIYFNVNMFLYKEMIRNYINTLFRCNRYFVDKYLVHLDGYVDGGRLVINLSIPTNCSQVFASVALFLVMPYKPWYLFSYLYPKPWFFLIPGAIQEFILVGQVLANYVLYQWILVAHTNSLEFWLIQSHNHNDSGYTKDVMRRPKTAIETYRTLQILCNIFNECMAPLAVPLMKTHIFTALIPCGFVFIRSMNHYFVEEFPGILTYPLGIIDCAFAAFVTLSMAAQVFDLACGFVDSWSRTKRKDFRRILMSCPTLKVKVGRLYFITVSTTITFFKQAIDYIIDCIITFP